MKFLSCLALLISTACVVGYNERRCLYITDYFQRRQCEEQVRGFKQQIDAAEQQNRTKQASKMGVYGKRRSQGCYGLSIGNNAQPLQLGIYNCAYENLAAIRFEIACIINKNRQMTRPLGQWRFKWRYGRYGGLGHSDMDGQAYIKIAGLKNFELRKLELHSVVGNFKGVIDAGSMRWKVPGAFCDRQ